MFDDFMSMDILRTFVGLTTAVTVIVQFTKSLVKTKHGDHAVRLYAFIISLILTAVFIKEPLNLQGIILTIINALMITVASTGSYEMVTDPMAQKSRR